MTSMHRHSRGLCIPLILFCIAAFVGTSPGAAGSDYTQFDQSDDDIKLTGRVYHASPGSVVVEAWPHPRKLNLKVDKITLQSPSGELYRAGELDHFPMNQLPRKRSGYRRSATSWLGDLFVTSAYASCGSCGSDGGSGGGGGEKPSGETDRHDAEAAAGFGLLMGLAAGSEKEWVTSGTFAVKEEPGQWNAVVDVVDAKGRSHRFKVPFALSALETPSAAPQPKRDKAASEMSWTDKETGLTTTITLNRDGSRDKTVTDRAGRVVETERRPPLKGATKTYLDPDTGLRITETQNPDGSVVRRAEDDRGNWSEGHRYPGGVKIPVEPPPTTTTTPPPTETTVTPPPTETTTTPPPTETTTTPPPTETTVTPPPTETTVTPPPTETTTTPPPTETTTTPPPEEEGLPLPDVKRPHTTDEEGLPLPTGLKKPPPSIPGGPQGPVIAVDDTMVPPGEQVGLVYGILLKRDDDTWVPEYRGSTTVTARIYEKFPTEKFWRMSKHKQTITARILERSNEPGMCLNKKLPQDPQNSPDIYFEQSRNPGTTCSGDPSGIGRYFVLSSTLVPTTVHTFAVTSDDYGATSRLDATAPDCVQLMLIPPDIVVDTDGKHHIVSEPKDDNLNRIADGYPPEAVSHPNPTDDLDAVPNGNGVAGDGLSAYEEYRGFFTQGKHVRTEWDRKDLFIRNRHNLNISRFVASELALHEINHDEWDTKSRLINYNNGFAHVVNEHALLLVQDNSLGSDLLGRADMWTLDKILFAMGPPKNVNKVRINVANHIGQTALLVTVAHELGHAVGIHHHGDPYFYDHWKRYVSQATGSVMDYLPGPRSVVVTTPELCGYPLPNWFYFGSKQNQASGCLDCMMRYDFWATVYKEDDGTLSCRGAEPDLTIFCDSPAGTGWNAGNRCAGNAASGRGNCKGQIIVNDK